MAKSATTDSCSVEIRKYPNRRYYNAAHGRYITLSEIRELICDGQDVHVVDSKSGEDITPKVLAQIILEHDSRKLQIFPIELLHQLIRTNEVLVRGFVESFFNQALFVFMESQRLFQRYLPGGNDLSLGNHRWKTRGNSASSEDLPLSARSP
jgi:polyhydroxyalkanoate synthesis repressor PhaR